MSGEHPRGPVHVHIEELVLHGVGDPADRHRIGEAVERELTRLLGLPSAGGWMSHGADAPVVDAGAFTVEGRATPDALGAPLARAIHGLGGLAPPGGRAV